MQFTQRQLRAFAAVADTGSFSAAAPKLHLTTSAVSLLVRELESAVGFRLFERTSRRVALTPNGMEFLPAARRVLHELQQAVIFAQDMQHRVSAHVTIAAPPAVAAALLPPLLARYATEHPEAVVKPVDCPVERLAEHVLAGRADIALGPTHAIGGELDIEVLFGSPWVVWFAPDHEFASRQNIQWKELASAKVIVPAHDYDHYMALVLERIAPAQRFTPSMVIDNATTALGMAASGMGVALCPAYVEPMARAWALDNRPLVAPAVMRDIALYLPTGRAVGSTARRVATFLREALGRPQTSFEPEREAPQSLGS